VGIDGLKPHPAQRGLVVRQRNPVDADDRHVEDVRDAGRRAAVMRFCADVTSLSRVPWVAQRTMTSTPPTVASTPVSASRSPWDQYTPVWPT
jgi:hypothetical protein